MKARYLLVVRSTLIACVAIVAWAAIFAVAAKALTFEYDDFPGIIIGIIGSTSIYAFPAVIAVRDGHRVRVAALAGATVALVDATIGWAVSSAIGPGAPAPDSTPVVLLLSVITVVVVGAVTGLIAGIVPDASRGGRPREPNPGAPSTLTGPPAPYRWPQGACSCQAPAAYRAFHS